MEMLIDVEVLLEKNRARRSSPPDEATK